MAPHFLSLDSSEALIPASFSIRSVSEPGLSGPGRILDGVRLNRGAGAGWTWPSMTLYVSLAIFAGC